MSPKHFCYRVGNPIPAIVPEFAKTGDLDARYHRWLLDAQDIRNVGDYGIDEEISSVQCQELTIWAKLFLEAANTHLAEA